MKKTPAIKPPKKSTPQSLARILPPRPAQKGDSVSVGGYLPFWKRLFAFSGPAFLISVGYMDPGNWATDLAAGSRYGYKLLWVLAMSNVMAILLQSLSARLGIVTRMDLAQACRSMFHPKVSGVLWVLAEIAIASCDLAEVVGSAIGFQLVFGIPLIYGVLLTTLDTFLMLFLQSRGVRLVEAFILTLVLTVGGCMAVEVFLAKPALGPIALGLIPSLPGPDALFLAIGIIGATVMPHNLYLHSALVQSRKISPTFAGIRNALKFNFIDSVFALNGAFIVNALLLILAAAAFFNAGLHEVAEIQDAHRLLAPLLGSTAAPILFGVALIASGQSSTITGTLAGQIVMEGFVNIRLGPVARRLLTRGLAIIPAVLTISIAGEKSTGSLLILSQVVLSLQLSFAVIPLIHLVSDKRWMGVHAIKPLTQVLAWLIAGVIAVLNLKLVFDTLLEWLSASHKYTWLLWVITVPLAAGLMALLFYVLVVPLKRRFEKAPTPAAAGVHGKQEMPEVLTVVTPKRIAVAVDFSKADKTALSHALMLARSAGRKATIVLFHIVESGGARLMGSDMNDAEAQSDRQRLELYANELGEMGISSVYDVGFGYPVDQLVKLIEKHTPDVLILGSHGHKAVGDFVLGTTIGKLRHRVKIPLLIVPAG